MQKKNLKDVIKPDIKFSVTESDDAVDGEHVLAKIKGQFFVPDGKSRNGRFYPSSLWEKVCNDPKVKSRLSAKTMFGTVGHDAELNDKSVREGLISHFMTNIYVDKDGKGIGEALILNTPTGRILNTVLRAGSQLFVSSRANGTFKGKQDGMPVVDEDNYDLDGWDFVIDPGFLEANPTIAESLEEIHNIDETDINDNNEDGIMNEKLIKHITDENASLKNKVSDLTDEVKTLEESNETLTKENENANDQLGKLEEANKVIEAYNEFGTVEEIKEKLEKATETETVLAEYKEVNEDPKALKESVEKSANFEKEVNEKLGSIENIEKALKTSIEFKESVDELGSVDDIKESLTTLKTIVETKEAEEKASKVKALAEELGLDEEKVEALLEKYSEEDIKDLYKVVAESNDSDDEKYKKRSFNESKKKVKGKNEEDDEEDEEEEDEDKDKEKMSESRVLSASRISRINETFGN